MRSLHLLMAVVLLVFAGAACAETFDVSAGIGKDIRRLDDDTLEVLSSEPYPSWTIRAADTPWDLSRSRYLEVDITNRWSKPLLLTFWALTGSGWGGVSTYPLNPAGRDTIPPGATQTLKIDLHARYPGETVQTNAIDASRVERIVFVPHIRQAGARFRLANLRVSGEVTAPTQDVTKRISVPPVTDEAPAAGKRVRRALPAYENSAVRHVLALPRDWQPGKRYPIIVEYTGNVFYHKFCYSTGLTEQGNLAWGLSGGEGFICLNLPFISTDRQREQIDGWGDVEKTVDYCIAAVHDACEQFGGDGGAVFVTGFSRGSYACSYIALHDDRIADVWLGLDRDPGRAWQVKDGKGWNAVGLGWDERAARVKGRATFTQIANLGEGVHVDVEYLEDNPTRRAARAWLVETLANRPGTGVVRGRVTDAAGQGIAGVRIASGPTHFAFTGEDGRYALAGLLLSERTVIASKPGLRFERAEQSVRLRATQPNDVNFVAVAPSSRP
jgi:hypothetical protein